MDITTVDLNRQVARRGFLKVLTATGISTAAATQLGGAALAQAGKITDLDILQLATTAEYLAVDAYTHALKADFGGDIQDYLAEALKQEQAHLDALIATIKGPFKAMPVARPMFEYPVKFTKENQIAVLRLLNALEDAFVGAYLGALPLIQNKDVLAAAGAILGNECVHRSLIRDSRLNLGDKEVPGPQVPNDRAFEVAITAKQASDAVGSFIKKM